MYELSVLLQCFRSFCIIMGAILFVLSGISVINHTIEMVKSRKFNKEVFKCLGLFLFSFTVSLGASGIIHFVPTVFDQPIDIRGLYVLLFIWSGFSLSLTCFYAHGSPRPRLAFLAYVLFMFVTYNIMKGM